MLVIEIAIYKPKWGTDVPNSQPKNSSSDKF